MSQLYHANAKTNVHIRTDIRKSAASNSVLAEKYAVSLPTIKKWKQRDEPYDKSSTPHNIHYAISIITSSLICLIRQTLWVSREDIVDMLSQCKIDVTSSAVYRCLVKNNINKRPLETKPPYQKFKEYEPGFVHIDVTYLPKIQGRRKYLFVAIDRATRLMFYKIYDSKTAENASDFLVCCKSFFPFEINTVLTDNGKEFSNRLHKGKNNSKTDKMGKFDLACSDDIEHRLTKPATPKTNGMVERVNLTIKANTILQYNYNTWNELEKHLQEFLIFYNCHRTHGSIVKELNVKTPLQACIKWKNMQPDIFKKQLLTLNKFIVPLDENMVTTTKQPCEL